MVDLRRHLGDHLQEREGVGEVEARFERQRRARQAEGGLRDVRGLAGTHRRAREDALRYEAKRRQACGAAPGFLLATAGEGTLGVALCAFTLGMAVAQQRQPSHAATSMRPSCSRTANTRSGS
jgi:hypothetical protein